MYSNESSDFITTVIVLQLVIIFGIIGICLVGMSVVKYVINDHYEKIHGSLLLIIKNQKTMSEAADQIKQALADAQAKVTKVAADVALLHSKIDALSTSPTPEEIDEIKSLAADLNTSLQAVDDATEDETNG